jgi:uncharacterized membrane protein SpoIIM required for sporulation
MAEAITAFVARRRPDWELLRELLRRLQRREAALSELSQFDALYRRAASDLAIAQARYPNTEAHRYLNQLCAEAYAAIYRPRPERMRAIGHFFKREFPQALRREKRFVLASAAVFLLATALGALVVLFDPRGVEMLVPEGVRLAVAQHKMWTDDLLRVSPPGVVASRIATNNLTVLVFTFASGLLLGVGTLFSLVNNGLMLGSVSALCLREHMGKALLAFVAGHGPVELSTIVIAGGAGLMLAHALVSPGERTRADALVARAREAMKLVIGCAPFLGAIALVEGFVSPGAEFAEPLKLAVGLGLGICFWGYLALAARGEPYRNGRRETEPVVGSAACAGTASPVTPARSR